MGRTGVRPLLASTSLAALLIGAGAPAAFAQCDIDFVNQPSQTSVSNPGGSNINCINIQNTPVTGNVTNAGVITATDSSPPTRTGITISNSSIDGAIFNSGLITSENGHGIFITDNSTVSGGISFAGSTVSTFSGGISNAGLISTTAPFSSGISLSSVANLTFSGGISNAGTISGVVAGINFSSVSIFGGGISNSGTISGGSRGINFTGVVIFSGGISNAGPGTISSPATSIFLTSVGTFLGGISNAGTISAGGQGIVIQGGIFSGGITNTGAISGTGIFGRGINVGAATFAGGISNAGTISGGTGGTGIRVFGVASFAGGLTNTGNISGDTGIFVQTSSPVSVFDSGTIVSALGDDGVAVNLTGNAPGNTFTLGPGYDIIGKVLAQPGGEDTFQLAGPGSDSINLSNIGPTEQYEGFTTFNVIGGVWTATGTIDPAQTQTWNVFNNAALVLNGELPGVDVQSGGTLGGDGTVVGAVTNAGTVEPGFGQTTFAPTMLTVGSYMGEPGSTLSLRTMLGADDSPTDQLIITTGEATGNSSLHITNVNGTGAETTGNGIPVVVTTGTGTTEPGAFTLANTELRAGAFDYDLERGGLNGSDPDDWFLRSTFIPGPVPPEPPIPPISARAAA